MRQISRSALFLSTLLVAGWCAFSLRGDLAQVSLAPLLRSWNMVALAVLLSLLNYALRIVRWRIYLTRLGHSLSSSYAAVTYVAGFAYTLSPGKVGEMVRARYYLPLGIPLAQVTAAFFVERLLDLIAMIVLATLLLTAVTRFASVMAMAVLIVAAVLVALAFMPWPAMAAKLESAPMPQVARKVLLGVTATLISTRPLLRPGMLAGGFTLALAAWGLEGAGLGLLGSMFPAAHLDVASAVGIYGIAVLVGGLSFLPGGLGSTEAVMTALLATKGLAVGDALLLTLVCRLVTLWFAVCLGWIAVVLLRQRTWSTAVAPWR